MTKQYKITVNGKTYDVSVEEVKPVDSRKAVSTIVNRESASASQTSSASNVSNMPSVSSTAQIPIDENAVSVKAAIPGTIISFSVAVGDKVQEGQVLVILEAMKMENEIVSPASGEIKSIHVEKGSSVVEGQVILQIK
ncbi:biotin/lipoyl-containing protein [uncultured Brachyspira sp.]|uniref:biotin/lipoyl-containing protein n=1 Tax=uncultured Brachyspira sp. TaxID=221953 RepID=UPI0025E23B70|nr:biotin/lipoyl-containing protein [uncultured Brachyspira sp.]